MPSLPPTATAPTEADALHAERCSAVDFAIIATDVQGRITDWNPGAENILQWSAAEMRGAPADRFFTPEDRAGAGGGRDAHGLARRPGQRRTLAPAPGWQPFLGQR